VEKWTHTHTLLRIGVAFAFIYPAISAWINPFSWIGYFPAFLLALAEPHSIVLLHVFGAIEIAIALWILFGRNILIPSALAAFMLFGIVAFNFSQMDVLFRDIPIFLMALILALEAYRNRSEYGASVKQ